MKNKTLRLVGCSALLALLSAGAFAAEENPNIIFLLTDDQRDNTFGIMGHPYIKTPNIDGLIQAGVRFSNAYIAEPTCAPSRVSFFTGMHERVHGVGFTSSYKLNKEQWEQTYPALLRKSGYYTGFIGKFGVEYYTFRGEAASKFDFWRAHDGWAAFFPKKKPVNCIIYFDSGEDIITPVTGESITRFLDAAPVDQPFCLSVSFSVPHGSQVVSMHDWKRPANEDPLLKDHPIYGSLYRDLAIAIPADTATDPYRYIPERLMDQNQGRKTDIYPYDYTTESCLEHHIRYGQMITGMDLAVGQMRKTLKAKGLDKNTIILFASDNGLLMGEYGMGGKGLLYDLTAKIPCFIYDPRLPKSQRGKTVEALVSSLDLTSTILDYAGVPQPQAMEGRSLRPLLVNANAPWPDSIFLENLYTGRDTPFSEGIRKGDWKYIRMYDGADPYTEKDTDFQGREPDFEQLFNLKDDPEEKTNLINQYEGQPLLATLRAQCRDASDALNGKRTEYKKTNDTPRR